MATPSDHDVDTLVQRILAEADAPRPPAVDLLRTRVARLSLAEQAELGDRARRRNLPLLTSTPSDPPAPGVIDRTRSAAGA